MIHLLTTALHIFVILAIAAFVISGISALTGTYDHWGNRYILKARRSRLIRERAKLARTDDKVVNIVPYKAYKPTKRTNVVFIRNRRSA